MHQCEGGTMHQCEVEQCINMKGEQCIFEECKQFIIRYRKLFKVLVKIHEINRFFFLFVDTFTCQLRSIKTHAL